jgi:hypothetical protein
MSRVHTFSYVLYQYVLYVRVLEYAVSLFFSYSSELSMMNMVMTTLW